MIGMAIAIATTLFLASPGLTGSALSWSASQSVAVRALIIAQRIPMTAMPQLVAAFHSLVGLPLCSSRRPRFYTPSSFDIGEVGSIHGAVLVEMSLGVAIGAITFTGSIIAFPKARRADVRRADHAAGPACAESGLGIGWWSS
jgi:NAD(P) transhydrogenase subunit beta